MFKLRCNDFIVHFLCWDIHLFIPGRADSIPHDHELELAEIPGTPSPTVNVHG